MKSKQLLQAINKVDRAMSKEYTFKPEIASVYLHTEDGYLWAVATDGFVLHKAKVARYERDHSILIKGDSIRRLKKKLKEIGNEDIDINVIDADMFQPGNFPDYKKIIPTEFKEEFIFSNKEVKEIVNELKKKKNEAKDYIKNNEINSKRFGAEIYDSKINIFAITDRHRVDIFNAGISQSSISVNLDYLIKALMQAKKELCNIKIKTYEANSTNGMYVISDCGDSFLISGLSKV